MSLGIESFVTENDGERNNRKIRNQTEDVEPIQFVLFSCFCSTANDVDSLNEEEINDDLTVNYCLLCRGYLCRTIEENAHEIGGSGN